MRKDFCAFILSHARPNNVKTYNTLKNCGYTGDIKIIIDNEDETQNQYFNNFGVSNVIIFDKKEISKTFDECDNFDNRKTIVYARNFCNDIASKLGYKYYIQLDDDYYWFGYRTPNGAKTTRKLDNILNIFIEYLEKTKITSIAFSQGGDHIGGYDENKKISRKAMNSFICSTDRPFKFIGRINEDVNTYVYLGGLGYLFFTIMNFQLDQKDTQSNKGGMTSTYLDGGTYVKSFYSVIINPSCVKVKSIGLQNKRLHHSISWENAVPMIIDEKYKK